ncbi:MAG: TIGR02710 family CRISPR-associated protein [Lachnospiraceae bacterium]|nr:TIGR02710 family CRISPR-associated protein [Lachnospiraceae bacterium]
MNKELENKTKEWMELGRKTQKQRETAEAFYEHKLMKLIVESYIERNKSKVYEEVEYLIVSVGTSYEPIVLNILLLKPKQILFLYTEKTHKYLDKIVELCKLKQTMFQKRNIHETNPLDIYREIKSIYLEWRKPEKIYIDFTGGTKSMSAAAAMAGAMINIQLVYVGTEDYLTDFRKPRPGSENLYFIDNPLQIFGDLQIEQAIVLFEQGNYSGARMKFEEIKEQVPEPEIRQQMEFLYLMSSGYEQWDSLDFIKASDYFKELHKKMQRDRLMHPTYALMDCFEKLSRQNDILQDMAKIPEIIANKKNMIILKTDKYIYPLIYIMYSNAMLREKQEKYDMATLLLYRVLEMIEQKRLANYGLYVSDMQYQSVIYNEEKHKDYLVVSEAERLTKLKESVFKVKKILFGKFASDFLPDRVSLLEGFVILFALRDEICIMKTGKNLDKLRRIRSMVYLRNNSIFAHGLGPVSYDDYKKFRNFVTEILKEFSEIEGINHEQYYDMVRFVTLKESLNIAAFSM